MQRILKARQAMCILNEKDPEVIPELYVMLLERFQIRCRIYLKGSIFPGVHQDSRSRKKSIGAFRPAPSTEL